MTTIPVRVNIPASRDDYGKGLALTPLVGLLPGLIMAGVHWLSGLIFPAPVAAVFVIAAYVFLTGGLHLDGLGDTADGLFSNRPRERILEIMKDSRVGTNAVIAVILLLLLNYSLISVLDGSMRVFILLMPVAGRVGSVIGAGISKYAGNSDGPGRWIVESCGATEILIGLFLQIIIFFTAAGIQGLLLSIIAPVTAVVLTKLLSRKLGGVTGDILGAVCELNQALFLAGAYAMAVLIRL